MEAFTGRGGRGIRTPAVLRSRTRPSRPARRWRRRSTRASEEAAAAHGGERRERDDGVSSKLAGVSRDGESTTENRMAAEPPIEALGVTAGIEQDAERPPSLRKSRFQLRCRRRRMKPVFSKTRSRSRPRRRSRSRRTPLRARAPGGGCTTRRRPRRTRWRFAGEAGRRRPGVALRPRDPQPRGADHREGGEGVAAADGEDVSVVTRRLEAARRRPGRAATGKANSDESHYVATRSLAGADGVIVRVKQCEDEDVRRRRRPRRRRPMRTAIARNRAPVRNEV